MNLQQIKKILKVMLIATILMFAFEILFADFTGISNILSNWVANIEQKWILYLVIWIIMYVQVCFIPIPAYIVLNAAIVAKVIDPTLGVFKMFSTSNCWIFIAIVISAYMLGAMTAYFMGYKWGRKAVKWCAGSDDEYDKWANTLNEKGKWWYALTVLLPVFPDDLLCLVAGSVKFNCNFFFISNLIGRSIGLICMIGALAIMQSANSGGIPWTMIGWGIAVLIEIIALVIINKKIKKRENTV